MTALSTGGHSALSFLPPALIRLYPHVYVVLIIDWKVQGRKKKSNLLIGIINSWFESSRKRKKKKNLWIVN